MDNFRIPMSLQGEKGADGQSIAVVTKCGQSYCDFKSADNDDFIQHYFDVHPFLTPNPFGRAA